MTKTEAHKLATAIYEAIPLDDVKRLKSIHVMAHLHEGHLTVRLFFYPDIAEDPAPYIFMREELTWHA